MREKNKKECILCFIVQEIIKNSWNKINRILTGGSGSWDTDPPQNAIRLKISNQVISSTTIKYLMIFF